MDEISFYWSLFLELAKDRCCWCIYKNFNSKQTMRFTHVLLCVALLVCCLSATTTEKKKSSRFVRIQEKMASLSKKRDAPEWTEWAPNPKMADLIPVNLTTEEQRIKYREMVFSEGRETRAVKRNSPIDLRSYGLRPIDNQGSCGSCYAFAGTHGIEDQYRLAGNSVSSPASVQHVLECCSNCHAFSSYCQGGYPNRVVNFIATQDDATTSCKAYHSGNNQAYPCYTTCDDGSGINHVPYGTYSGPNNAYVDDIKSNLGGLKPVVTSFYVPYDFVGYFNSNPSGVYPKGLRTPGTTVSTVGGHAVEIVGWGVDGGRDYFVVKNSYGTGWGNGGYFKWDVEDSRHFSLVTNSVLGDGDDKRRQDGEESGLAYYGSDENLGGLMDVDNDDEEVVEAADFAVAEINEVCDGENFVVEKILDTQVQSITGSLYHIYLQASTPSKFLEDECTRQYHAHVVVDLEGNFELFNFKDLEPNVGLDLSKVEENIVIYDDDTDSGSETVLPSIVMMLFAVIASLMF